MKRKKPNWDAVPWTEFQPAVAVGRYAEHQEPDETIWVNSRYQVSLTGPRTHPWGRVVELSIKTLDRSARHDWRDFQRIKNELVGEEWEAIELYPAESRMVDTANQYYLFAFEPPWRAPVGFVARLVMAQDTQDGSRQRPWPKGETPKDAISVKEFHELREAYERTRRTTTGLP
jgi:hypothetical protein